MDTILFKYHGHGEDYLVYDTCINRGDLDEKAVRTICARNFGLGALGILAGPVLDGSRKGVRLYRPDGSQDDLSDRETEIFTSYLRDAGYRDGAGLLIADSQAQESTGKEFQAEKTTGTAGRNQGERAQSVGKLFLSDEFMRKNHICQYNN